MLHRRSAFLLLLSISISLLAGRMSGNLSGLLRPQDGLNQPVQARWDASENEFLILVDGGVLVKHFDLFLKPTGESNPLEPFLHPKPTAALSCDAPGERQLQIDVTTGKMQLSFAPWENARKIEWGEGWVAISFRVANPMGELEWQAVGAGNIEQHIQRVSFWADPKDPLSQIAHIEGLASGQVIRVRHRPARTEWPKREWVPWIEIKAP
ncbi:MAG: hypothetical protein HN405_06785 [Planctomycetes bacterium]|jgi:hypothetical protein|nr:hypothetical protein [Planctomycetota bacterium]MBT4028113.1 hypothetical protein [Planctomycetota bacterium]MBT4561008.1 hypothetical protein [Planctomycetota bacterium]MBT7012621.1 hypothetical protein [Planctomycetota bacterium]MBT7317839.1 hypothetical protein [Planctomycetota bacterium]